MTFNLGLQTRLALSGILVLLFVCFSNLAIAAQLVNSTPNALENNWMVCSHYKSAPASCKQLRLPLANQRFSRAVEYQTFSKQVIFSDKLKYQPLGLWIEYIDDVDEVYINGKLIGRTGSFLPAFDSAFRYQRHYFIAGELLRYNQFNQILIKTFSSRGLAGIQSSPPHIVDYLTQDKDIHGSDLQLWFSAFFLLLLTIFQLFYFIVIKDNYETIYCSLFLICFALFTIARSQLPLNLGLELSTVFKFESFLLNIGLISIAIFIFKFFELELRRNYILLLFIMGICGVLVITWPFAEDLRLFSEINYLIQITGSFLVIGSALIIAFHKQRKYAITIGLLCVFSWLTLVYDCAMLSAGFGYFELAMHKGVAPLVAAFAGLFYTLLLTHKYWLFFKGSTYDHLTGALLRPAFFQRVSEEMQRCQRGDAQLLVAVIDIQHARKISVNYGYSTGNHLLSAVSNSLNKELRPFDLICRFSDEQFCIAASIDTPRDANTCIRRIYDALGEIQQPVDQGIELHVDAKVGGVVYDKELHLTVSQLIQDANYALSKARGQSQQNFLLIQNPGKTAA